MRQRRIADEGHSPSRPALRRMAAVDMFPKPKEDFQRQQTSAGAVVSAVTVGIILFLVLWEGISYALGWSAYSTDLSIDHNANRSMDVNIDISFPRTSCNSLSVDIRDAAASQRINVTQLLQKIPLTQEGRPAFAGRIVEVGDEAAEEGGVDASTACQKCFLPQDIGALANKVDTDGNRLADKCCATCGSVALAYDAAGLPVPPQNRVLQCLGDIAAANPGCRIVGVLHLKKISGTLVFAPRQTKNAYHISDLFRFRADHRINRLVIGNPRVRRFSKQGVISHLEGFEYKHQSRLSEVRYFLSVVPTTYNTKQRQASNVRTYEYAVQWRARDLSFRYNEIPAVMFSFDFSPIQIDNYFVRPPLTQFLVKLCGIVGGLFVVLSIVDRVVARLVQLYD